MHVNGDNTSRIYNTLMQCTVGDAKDAIWLLFPQIVVQKMRFGFKTFVQKTQCSYTSKLMSKNQSEPNTNAACNYGNKYPYALFVNHFDGLAGKYQL